MERNYLARAHPDKLIFYWMLAMLMYNIICFSQWIIELHLLRFTKDPNTHISLYGILIRIKNYPKYLIVPCTVVNMYSHLHFYKSPSMLHAMNVNMCFMHDCCMLKIMNKSSKIHTHRTCRMYRPLFDVIYEWHMITGMPIKGVECSIKFNSVD